MKKMSKENAVDTAIKSVRKICGGSFSAMMLRDEMQKYGVILTVKEVESLLEKKVKNGKVDFSNNKRLYRQR